jgi:oligopeptidase B
MDHYAWLKKKSDPRVVAYLNEENAYTEAYLKSTEAFQEKLYQEMLGRILQTDLSVPYRLRGYEYYTRTEEGKQYPIYCRRKSEERFDTEGTEKEKAGPGEGGAFATIPPLRPQTARPPVGMAESSQELGGEQAAGEEVLLDLNLLAAGHTFMGLGLFEVSDDNRLLAYATDTTGFRQYVLEVKD